MAEMVVAYWMPHNDGIEMGTMEEPGQTTGLDLVDLYEVDGQIRTFTTKENADKWLSDKHAAYMGSDRSDEKDEDSDKT